MNRRFGLPDKSTADHGSTPALAPVVAVLMGTKDGAAFLDEQIDSLAIQNHQRIDVWVSDDASTDGTVDILQNWRKRWKKGSFHILEGPNAGFAENYRSLIRNEAIEADYYAFCDQDDIWEPMRLSKGVAWASSLPADHPALFCSRTLTISETGTADGMSPLFVRRPSFRNALVQSIAGGNTMLLNRQARKLLQIACERTGFVSHDWWTYIVLSGVGASIHYSDEPLVRYRQHGANAFGQNSTILARIDRIRRLFEGDFRAWTASNLKGLLLNRDLLTPDAVEAYRLFAGSRKGGVLSRLRMLYASGIYRQTIAATIALFVATAFGRV